MQKIKYGCINTHIFLVFLLFFVLLGYKKRSDMVERVVAVAVEGRVSGSSERVYTEMSVLSAVSIQVIVLSPSATLYDVLHATPSLYSPEIMPFSKPTTLIKSSHSRLSMRCHSVTTPSSLIER